MIRRFRFTRSKGVSVRELLERQVYFGYISNCRRKNIKFEIAFDLFQELIHQNCHYCGRRPSNRRKGRGTKANTSMRYQGVDRKNNLLGYFPENLVPCCQECNQIKSDILSYEEMLEVARLLKAIRAGDLTLPTRYQLVRGQEQLARLLTTLKSRAKTRR